MDTLQNKGIVKIKFGLFFVIEMLLCALTVWCTFTEHSGVVSALFKVSFIILLVLFLASIPKKANTFFALAAGIMIMALINVAISWTRNSVPLTFDSLENYFIFCATIICIYLSVEIEISEKYRQLLLGLCVMISALFPLAALLIDFVVEPYFTMNFSNPNLTGMFLAQAVFYAAIGIASVKKPIGKLLCIVLAVTNVVLLFWTEARNSILSVVLFSLLLIWLLTKNKKNIPDIILRVTAIFPALFIFIYMALIELEAVQETFDFVADVGKPLTSRVEIWTSLLEELGSYFMIGNYFVLNGNAHNSHLVVLVSYGVVVLALTIFYLYRAMERVNARCRTKSQMVCLTAFAGSLFIGMGEGALFSGGIGLYLMCCVPLLLGKSGYEQKSE